MMLCRATVLVLAASLSAHAKEEECTNSAPNLNDDEALLLLQVDKGRKLVEAKPSEITSLVDSQDGLPDHIVCHTQSCAEVQASLAVIKSKQKVAKQKLDECSKSRKQLQSDLAAAAAKRAEAEKGLAKCAAERSALQKELQQCAEVDRPNAEKALAQCAQERAKLEAELRQCAVVDRPAAEKGLAECAKERALLEAKLKKLAAGMKGGAAVKSKHRRRRRSKASSLTEVSAEVHSDTETMSEKSSLGLDEESQMQEAVEVQASLDEINDRAQGYQKQLAAADAREANIEARMAKLVVKEQKGQAALKIAEAKFGKIATDMEVLGKDISTAETEVESATENAEKVGADLAAQQNEETAALLQLASLMQEEHRILHSHLEEQHHEHAGRLQTQDVALHALATKAKDEECDKARAEVITAKGNLELTDGALKACLSAKKEIKAKIEYVVALGEEAAAGLQKCLNTKAELKVKIKQCHDRRDLARQKLQECLDRKKVLKEQIDKCHAKRDEAREKLKACLARKAELKTKINNMMKRSSLIQQASNFRDELAQLHKLHADAESNLDMLLVTLEGENGELARVVRDLQSLSGQIKQAVSSMGEASAESDSWTKDLAYAEQDDAASGSLSSKMGEELNSAVEKLHRVSATLAGAVKANDAAGKQVDKVEKAVSLMMEKGF